jgi:hypothetical protein
MLRRYGDIEELALIEEVRNLQVDAPLMRLMALVDYG